MTERNRALSRTVGLTQWSETRAPNSDGRLAGTRPPAAILEAHADERELREAIEAFWSYPIPGLKGFARWSDRRSDAGRPGAGGASIP